MNCTEGQTVAFTPTFTTPSGSVVDISACSTRQIWIYQHRTSEPAIVTASFVTDGTDGKITATYDMDVPGPASAYGYASDGTRKYWTSAQPLTVQKRVSP